MESLLDASILESLEVVKMETLPRPEHMKADYMPDIWTGCEFVGDVADVDSVAERLSRALTRGWFVDMDTKTHNYLVFGGKVVKYERQGGRGIGGQPWPEEAKQAARDAGVPSFVK